MFVVLRLAELKKCDCRRVFRWKMRSKRYQNCTRKDVYRTSGSPFCHHLGEASKIFLSDSSGGSVRPHKSLSCFPNCVSYVSREEEEETRGNISYSVNGVYLEGDKLDGVVVPAAQALDLDANCRPIESRRFVPEVGSRWALGVNESMPRFEHTVRVTAFYWRAFGR